MTDDKTVAAMTVANILGFTYMMAVLHSIWRVTSPAAQGDPISTDRRTRYR